MQGPEHAGGDVFKAWRPRLRQGVDGLACTRGAGWSVPVDQQQPTRGEQGAHGASGSGSAGLRRPALDCCGIGREMPMPSDQFPTQPGRRHLIHRRRHGGLQGGQAHVAGGEAVFQRPLRRVPGIAGGEGGKERFRRRVEQFAVGLVNLGQRGPGAGPGRRTQTTQHQPAPLGLRQAQLFFAPHPADFLRVGRPIPSVEDRSQSPAAGLPGKVEESNPILSHGCAGGSSQIGQRARIAISVELGLGDRGASGGGQAIKSFLHLCRQRWRRIGGKLWQGYFGGAGQGAQQQRCEDPHRPPPVVTSRPPRTKPRTAPSRPSSATTVSNPAPRPCRVWRQLSCSRPRRWR